MSKMIEATFDGKVLRVDEPLDFEPNTRVWVTIEPMAQPMNGTESFLDTALSLNLEGPPDWSARVDDYLHGNDGD
ncbi:MAG: antitoxin family protein [Pyrinomonadaceae bacterium]